MKFTSFLFLLLIPFFSQAQNPCGTPSQKSSWLTKFQHSPDAYAVPEDDTILYIPMTIHLVGTDTGKGYYRFNSLLNAICRLNSDYAQANIQFFLESPIHYINSDKYNKHSTVIEGAQMMFENDVPHTLNTYFLDDPAGNCGYNLPYASIAINISCSGANAHTWAHEVGHAFTLPHPFLGWEGKTYSPSQETPTTVTYDYTFFKDTLILDTLIIDTTFVELVDGSNCLDAADGFCDTPPDYLSYRWLCAGDNSSTVLQKDPNGETFYSDGAYFMSYSLDNCQSLFSQEQIAAMRAYIINEHPDFLYNQIPSPALAAETTTLISPKGEIQTDPNYSKLTWTSVGEANYRLLVSRTHNFGAIILDTIITDTTFVLNNLEDHFYYWEVRPFSKYQFCLPKSARAKFKADPSVVSINDINAQSFNLFPTYLPAGSSLQINATRPISQDIFYSITDLSGHALQQNKIQEGSVNFDIPLSEKLKQGIYFFNAHDNMGWLIRQKIVVY